MTDDKIQLGRRFFDELVDMIAAVTLHLVVSPADAEPVRQGIADNPPPKGVTVTVHESPFQPQGELTYWYVSSLTGEVIAP